MTTPITYSPSAADNIIANMADIPAGHRALTSYTSCTADSATSSMACWASCRMSLSKCQVQGLHPRCQSHRAFSWNRSSWARAKCWSICSRPGSWWWGWWGAGAQCPAWPPACASEERREREGGEDDMMWKSLTCESHSHPLIQCVNHGQPATRVKTASQTIKGGGLHWLLKIGETLHPV